MAINQDSREIELEELTCAEARADGWHERKCKWVGRVGAPDRVFMKDGRTVWIEFKRPKGGHRKGIQINEGKRILDAGGEFYFVSSVDEAHRILKLGKYSHG